LKSEGLIETATGPMGEVVYHKGDYFPYGYIPGTYLTAKEA